MVLGLQEDAEPGGRRRQNSSGNGAWLVGDLEGYLLVIRNILHLRIHLSTFSGNYLHAF